MSLQDPITSLQDPLDQAPEEDPHRLRLLVLRGVILLAFLLLVVQLYRLQVVQGGVYRDRADNNRFRLMPISAPRGVIYDRNQALLARNRPTYTVGIIAADLPVDPLPIFRRLSQFLDKSPQEIQKAVEESKVDRFTLIPLRTEMSQELAFTIDERNRELPGVHVVTQPNRDYLEGSLTSNIIGYLGPINAEQYQKLKDDRIRRYTVNDRIGQTGIEADFEKELRGGPGQRRLEVDVGGHEVRLLSVDAPTSGNNLVLTIDLALQRFLAQKLASNIDKYHTASAVAIDPQTGQILALVHLPSYDNSMFSRGITEEELAALLNDDRKPLVNGAISSAYSPGELFRAITAAGALQEEVVKPDQKVNCPGSIIVPSRLDPTLGTRFGDSTNHGEQDVVSALANSCEIYFYLAGGGDPDGKTEGLGIDRLVDYAKRFGLGSLSGLNLDGESDGHIGAPAWKKEAHNEIWYKGDTYQAATGADYILATPLQMANAIAAIANGGTLFQPQLVLSVIDDAGNVQKPFQAKTIRQVGVSPENLAAVRDGLTAATGKGITKNGIAYDGTAKEFSIPGLNLAGSLDSIEYDRAGPDHKGAPLTHGWFVGFGPSEGARIAIAIFIERGTGEEAAGIARDALLEYLKPPTVTPTPSPTLTPIPTKTPTPTPTATRMPPTATRRPAATATPNALSRTTTTPTVAASAKPQNTAAPKPAGVTAVPAQPARTPTPPALSTPTTGR